MTYLVPGENLRRLRDERHLEPYIEYIRFPRYKKLLPGTKIEFTFPICALVGPNGTSKSSILKALYGSPRNNNLGNLWFSTSVDPIEETGVSPSCFIYGYWNAGAQRSVEVIKTRIRNGSDPDYWEPSRPVLQHGMERMPALERGVDPPEGRSRTRWNTIDKEVVYLDFRSSLSAFDKFFYHGEMRGRQNSEKIKKELIRRRSPHLKRCVDDDLTTYRLYSSERLVDGINYRLNLQEVRAVSYILGRQYFEVRMIRHSFFNCDAYTCLMTTSHLNYSEAFAGSGEFSICRIVAELNRASDNSLVLLDEPEVSLHPGAQERLMHYLTHVVARKKHQIVLATHSPSIIGQLPKDAIKVLVPDPATGQIQLPKQASLNAEAFFHLGAITDTKITLVVEDALAAAIVRMAIARSGQAVADQFEIRHFPGGSQTLWKHYIPIFAAENRRNLLVILDGDLQPEEALPNPADMAEGTRDRELKRLILEKCGVDVEFHPDGGAGGGNAAQIEALRKGFVVWSRGHVSYLPRRGLTPEEFLWEEMLHDELSREIENGLDAKRKFECLAKKEFGLMEFEAVSSADILSTQRKRLASLPADHPDLVSLGSTIIEYAESENNRR